MSDPEVPQNDRPENIDDVVGSANEGLDAAAAARADVPGPEAEVAADEATHVDPDAEAFATAERDFPGTFAMPAAVTREEHDDETAVVEQDHTTRVVETAESAHAVEARVPAEEAPVQQTVVEESSYDAPTTTIADTAYAAAPPAAAAVAASEPMAPPASPQPIFVQAPEPPRELGNRGTAGAIGLLATLVFAVLYLGATLGLGALDGKVTGENIGTAALTPLTTWSFWVPVVVFFLAFWLLGAFVNRARWGKWVVLGLLVALATYGGHILGQLFQAPFWSITPSESVELVDGQLLAPLAIAAFVFARELTIWFGAWVSRSGARKKELNAEAQAEYERTLEAGPGALR